MRTASPLIAFAVASLGIAAFSTMDAVMKGLVLALGVYNAMTWRSLVGAVVSAVPYALSRPPRPSREAMRLHIIRGLLAVVVATLFFWGLGRVPMAQAIALAFIAPILALILAAWLLKEKISRNAIIATVLAFIGVMVILWGQSQSEMGKDAFWGSLAILGSAVCYAWNLILMRQQSQVASANEVAFYQSLISAAVFLLAAPFWLTLPPVELAPNILASAVLVTLSIFLLSWAYGRAEASYLAPTEYTGFLWASIWGWVVFGERVSPYTLAGAVLIVAGCVIAARRRQPSEIPEDEAVI